MLAGAVKQLRAANPNTAFAAAGDLIGASTFESFIEKDKPTIDALNEAGLDVSAVGNHEFDQGYDDLVNRVMEPASASNPYGGADWKYLAANVRFNAGDGHALAPTWTKEFGSVKVGYRRCGHRAPARAGVPGWHLGDQRHRHRDEVNAAADDLKADGADVIVMLVHEGAPDTNCVDMATSARHRLRFDRPGRSTTTSTRSCRVTPTWPTTARSRSQVGRAPVAR